MRWQKGGRRDNGAGGEDVGGDVVEDVGGDVGEDVGGDVGEDGGGDEEPSKLREEKVGRSGLSTLVTWRLPDSGVGDGRWWREGGGRGSPSGTLVAALAKEAWWAGCGGLSLLGHGGGGVDQELVARVEQEKMKKMMSRTQAAA